MFDVGGGELLLIVLGILVLFGPRKIPEVAQMVGKGMRKVRSAQDEFTQHLRDISQEVENVTHSLSDSSTTPHNSQENALIEQPSSIETQYSLEDETTPTDLDNAMDKLTTHTPSEQHNSEFETDSLTSHSLSDTHTVESDKVPDVESQLLPPIVQPIGIVPRS